MKCMLKDKYEGKRILLISMLPGLGKSTLAKNTLGVIDYEDWLEEKGLSYKKDFKATEHINDMLEENKNNDYDLIIFSSIHWDDMNESDVKSSLLIHMKPGEYDCEEMEFRDRRDLCEKHGGELNQWNSDYIPLAKVRKSYTLEKGKFVDLEYLINNGYFSEYYEVSTNNKLVKK